MIDQTLPCADEHSLADLGHENSRAFNILSCISDITTYHV
jgi:hypothetical protein